MRFLCKKVSERMRVIQKCIHTVTFDVSFVMDEFWNKRITLNLMNFLYNYEVYTLITNYDKI